ncbi:hypothetical protein RN001_005417 [Aquatica leii]|uniref:DNA mismatch repair proteins mutS family domain-containing protein n=1 Tax=Aquatica leii TaxID=1421715 RepID=A0AAN7PCP4_9COLE|nr:hypothetical protein RN001_005417 [Aquatica leii]
MSKHNYASTNEALFSVQKNSTTPMSGKIEISQEIATRLAINATDDSEEARTILCVLWKNGKLGAAYYTTKDHQLYILQEMVDSTPEFEVTRSLHREVDPTHTITIGKVNNVFVKCLINIIAHEDDDERDSNATESIHSRPVPSNLSLLHLKEFSSENCDIKVYGINLPSEPENATSAQKEVFLHSLIDFDCKTSLHSLGALIKYMEQNWSNFNSNERELKFLHVNQVALHNSVLIDRNTFNGLQIFEKESQDSNFKHCRESNSTERHSIFGLFSQHCKSKLGYMCLRNLLKNPTKDLTELNKRLDFIQFALLPANQGFIQNLQDNIKKISDVTVILKKIQYAVANSNHWETLYNTIFNTIFLHELCVPHRKTSSLFSSLDSAITPKLYELQYCIYNTLDFTQHNKENRPLIKFGLDAELDAKEFKKQDIAKNVTAAARIAVNQLPEYLNECSVVYIPEMGHFVAVTKWEANGDWNAPQSYGFHFVFETNDCLHYKNPMCYELDKQLGNIHFDILTHQNRIIQRLSDLVLRFNKDIREPLKIIGMIDCFISISRVVKEKDYVRPSLNINSTHEIEDGRHPLLELLNNNFVPNNFYSGGNYSRMKILTGPNNGGKSVFLKQTALIIYLAHVGCYVPAKKANIGIVHSIHSRIHAAESAGVNLSAFMLDLSQTSQALHNAKSSSLVLIDEFGRGTTADDGLALLVAALKKFSNKNESYPHVVVSTHFQEICKYLPESNMISYLKMDHEIRTSDEFVYLYKVTKGISNSFAIDVASVSGLDSSIINKSKEIYRMLTCNNVLPETDGNFDVSELNVFDIKIPEPDD